DREQLADDEFLREAFWLAQFIPARSGQDSHRITPPGAVPPPKKPGEDAADPKRGGDIPPPVAPPVEPQPVLDAPEQGRLYPPVQPIKGGNRKGSPIYVPASGALPQPLELARAL